MTGETMRKFGRFTYAAGAILIGLPMAALGVAAAPASASAAPLTIAFITSETGPGASEYTGSAAVFKAALDAQNAKGGVNGHKLVPLVIDDQTSPTALATGVQEAISRGVIGIVSNSPIFELAAKYPQQAGVPVTGNSEDGSEWGTQPYTNMFGIGSAAAWTPSTPSARCSPTC